VFLVGDSFSYSWSWHIRPLVSDDQFGLSGSCFGSGYFSFAISLEPCLLVLPPASLLAKFVRD
jgi:hypothetical protein